MNSDEKPANTATAQVPPQEDEEFIASVTRMVAEDGWEAACAFIEVHWDRLASSRPALLIEVLSALPGVAFVEHPSLAAGIDYLRTIQSSSDRPAMYSYLSPKNTGGDIVDRLVSVTKRATQHRRRGEYGAALVYATEARTVADQAESSMSLFSERTLAHLRLEWARCFEAAGSDRAISEYERAFDEALHTDQPTLARLAAASLAWVRAEEGQLELAGGWISRAYTLGEKNPRHDAPLHLAEALVAADRLDRDAAKAALERLDTTHIGEYACARFLVRAASTYSVTEAVLLEADIEAELPRIQSLLAEPGASIRQLTVARAFLGVRESVHEAIPAHGENRPEADILNAVVDYRRGQPRIAARHVARWTGPEHPPRPRSFALLLAGIAHLDGGHPGAAIDALRRAHTLIEHNGLLQTYRILTPAHLEASFAHLEMEMPADVRKGLALDLDASPTASDLVARLTPREREMLIALTDSGTVAQIAARLHVSANTVKTTLRNVYAKLEVGTRAEAADIAFRVGIGEHGEAHQKGSPVH